MKMRKKLVKTSLSRRDFLKAAGLTSAAAMFPGFLTSCATDVDASSMAAAAGMTVTAVNQASPLEISERTVLNVDILVIGGGIAGTFAAVTAKEQGLDVVLVDKGTVGRSGATPWAAAMSVFDEERDDRDEWLTLASSSSEYVNNHDWMNQMMDNSRDCWDAMTAWGMFEDDVQHPSLVMRDALLDHGVTLVERTMITTLLTEGDDERVIGAMGFSLDSEQPVAILAKATIMAAGAGCFKAPGFPIQGLTSDGDAMAYRVGARISGKEWMDFHFTYADYPASCWYQWKGMWDTGIGEKHGVNSSGISLDRAFDIHTGTGSTSGMPGGEAGGAGGQGQGGAAPADGERPEGDAPPDSESTGERAAPADGERPQDPPSDSEGIPPEGDGTTGEAPEGGGERPSGGGGPGGNSGTQILGAALGLGIHKAEGIWPTSMQGASDVPGLYGAGDALASMVCGASYTGGGISLSGSATQGMAAAQGAAEYVQQVSPPSLSDEELDALQTEMYAPRELESGFSPAWVTQVMQNTLFPYYVLLVKQEDRMQSALTNILFIKENLASRMTASDAHELKLAHETHNMLLNAEMKLRASLARKESRGTHYREDYPARDDDNYLVWILMQQDENGDMVITQEDIPEEWHPDASTPYEELYPSRFPGELEYLGLE